MQVYNGGTVNEQVSQKWFVKFCSKDFLLKNAPLLSQKQ